MKFESVDGSYFETRIVGYENYPGQVDNWLVSLCRLSLPSGNGHFIDAYAATDELQLLSEWLEKIANGSSSTNYFLFQEPNVQYKSAYYLDGMILFKILVYFSTWHDIEPIWVTNDGKVVTNEDDMNFTFECTMTVKSVKAAAFSLKRELLEYPSLKK